MEKTEEVKVVTVPAAVKDCKGDGTRELSHRYSWEHSEPRAYDFAHLRCQRCGERKVS